MSTSSSAMWRFFQTPKGLLIIVLAILVAVTAPHEGIRRIAPGLAAAVVVAGVMDLLILRKMHGEWEFPSGAVLTGLIVAMILTPQEPWYVGACTVGHSHCQQIHCPHSLGQHLQSGGSGAGGHVLHFQYRAELVGRFA